MDRIAVFDCSSSPLDVRMTPMLTWTFREPWEYASRVDDTCSFYHVIAGSMVVGREGGAITLLEGEIGFSFAGEPISISIATGSTIRHCHFTFGKRMAGDPVPDLVASLTERSEQENLLESLLLLPTSMHIHASLGLHGMLEDLSEPARVGGASGDLLRKAGLVRLLARVSQLTFEDLSGASLRSKPSTGALHVRRALDLIDARLTETISVIDIADSLGLGADYLGRLFKETLGMSVGACILRTRIFKARTLLNHQDLSVKLVAQAVGYADQRYFSRVFKEQTGLSPRAFRLAQSRMPGPQTVP